jgi:transformer-2 protein
MEGEGGYSSSYQGSGSVPVPAYESHRRNYSRSPVRARSRSPIRARSPAARSPVTRRYSRSPRRRHSRSRSPVGRYESRGGPRDYNNRDSRGPRDYRDSRDSRDYRDSRFERRDRFERRPPRERRPVNRGSEEERANSKTIFVGNLPFHFEERDVAHLMERFGPLRKITIPVERFARRNRGFCFVEFEERRDAEDAMQKYQGYAVEGRELRLDWDAGSDRKFPPREDREPRGADYRGDTRDSYRSRSDAPSDDRKIDRSPVNRSRSLSRSPVRPEDF